MQITISTADGGIFGPVDVSDDLEVENFLALMQAEIPSLTGVPTNRLLLFHSGRVLSDQKRSLKESGIVDGDIVLVQLKNNPSTSSERAPNPGQTGSLGFDFGQIQVPDRGRRAGATRSTPQRMSMSDLQNPPSAEALRQSILADQGAQSMLREGNQPLAAVLHNKEEFERLYNQQMSARRDDARRRFNLLTSDPFDPSVQRMIEQEIQQEEIESHFSTALEHVPEAFATVTMLYIRCRVNGNEVKAFVDTGAQTTIISESCARRCNITRLIDRRFTGVARGVGTSTILGRIHLAMLQIEGVHLHTTFTVLEDPGVEMLLGLDMLKRHQCTIDLRRNILLIGTTNTETTFLPENELPETARHAIGGGGFYAEDEAATSQATASATGQQPSPGAAATTVTPDKVEKLVAMGFSRDAVIHELTKVNGDLEKAIAALVANSLPMPPSLQ